MGFRSAPFARPRNNVNVRVNCSVASAVLLAQNERSPRLLLLRRSSAQLRDEWCHVAGGIEPGETAWQAALREIGEETGLAVQRFYSADYTEQFYEMKRNIIQIVPAFVAYVDAAQPVRLNSEHSAFRWVTFVEAKQMVPFGSQRRLYEEIQREFVDREPSHWLAISIAGDLGARLFAEHVFP